MLNSRDSTANESREKCVLSKSTAAGLLSSQTHKVLFKEAMMLHRGEHDPVLNSFDTCDILYVVSVLFSVNYRVVKVPL